MILLPSVINEDNIATEATSGKTSFKDLKFKDLKIGIPPERKCLPQM